MVILKIIVCRTTLIRILNLIYRVQNKKAWLLLIDLWLEIYVSCWLYNRKNTGIYFVWGCLTAPLTRQAAPEADYFNSERAGCLIIIFVRLLLMLGLLDRCGTYRVWFILNRYCCTKRDIQEYRDIYIQRNTWTWSTFKVNKQVQHNHEGIHSTQFKMDMFSMISCGNTQNRVQNVRNTDQNKIVFGTVYGTIWHQSCGPLLLCWSTVPWL